MWGDGPCGVVERIYGAAQAPLSLFLYVRVGAARKGAKPLNLRNLTALQKVKGTLKLSPLSLFLMQGQV